MAKSYVHELGDRLSNGSTADNLPSHIKEIAPVMYNDGSNNFNSIQGALNGKADKVVNATAGDVATLDANGNIVDSGNTLGTSVPANAIFTDTKVTQTKTDSGSTAYPLLMAGSTDPNGTATTARYDSGVKLTPSTNTISANISGNAATATSATKATQDSDGNAINATYFKSNAGTTTLQSGAAVKVGTQNGADVKLQLPAIPTATTTTPKMDGTAAVGSETTWAKGDHVHPSDTSREAVANKTTVVLGTSDSKYPTDKAVADFVNSSIATNTANYISDNGEPFTSVEELEAYPGIVTNNDYAFVTGTDSAGNTYYDRYKATVRGSTVTWALEYRLNNSSFTAAQWEAINSGITSALVGKIHEHANKAVLDGITATDVSNWNGKKDKQTAVTFTGSTLKTPTSITQDANGELAVTFTDIQSASTSQKGVVQLSDAVNSTDTDKAATANAVKTVYGLASTKITKVSGATEGNIPVFDANGEVVDSGKKPSDFEPTSDANEVIAAALNEINARLESVEDRENFGDLVAETVSMQEFPRVGGKSMVLFGSSAPDSAPSYEGQLYLDLMNKNLYFSVGQSSASDWVLAKKKQSAVTLNGSTIKTVTQIAQDANGNMSATFEDIRSASTTQKGVVQLSDSTASASSETAATSAAVKQAYDLAASKQEAITWMMDAEALQLWTDAWNAAT